MITLCVIGAFWKVPVIAGIVAGALVTLWTVLALYGRARESRSRHSTRAQYAAQYRAGKQQAQQARRMTDNVAWRARR
jgi:hypothetical protein